MWWWPALDLAQGAAEMEVRISFLCALGFAQVGQKAVVRVYLFGARGCRWAWLKAEVLISSLLVMGCERL